MVVVWNLIPPGAQTRRARQRAAPCGGLADLTICLLVNLGEGF